MFFTTLLLNKVGMIMLPQIFPLPDNWNYYVYKITCVITDKVYIGITCNPGHRWSTHRRDAQSGKQYKFQRAIRKHGWNNFIIEVIATCYELHDAKAFEIRLIQEYDSFNNGYNSTLGGEGCKGFKMPAEHIEKLIKRNTGRVVSKETRQRLREYNLGKKHTSITKDKCRIAGKKRKTTDEYRKKLSDSSFKRYPKKHFYNPDVGYFYMHIKELCDIFLSLQDSKLSAVVQGKRNHHKNWSILSNSFDKLDLQQKKFDIESKQVSGSKKYSASYNAANFYNPKIGFFNCNCSTLSRYFKLLNASSLSRLKRGKIKKYHGWVVLTGDFINQDIDKKKKIIQGVLALTMINRRLKNHKVDEVNIL